MLPRKLFACVLIFPVLAAESAPSTTRLWPGARYTTADRDRAIERGMDFLYHTASEPKYFADWGHDLLWCFYTISATAKNPKLRQTAWKMGHERAIQWRRDHSAVPPGASADDIADLVFGSDAADRLGVPGPDMKERLRQAVARYTAVDYLQFDPTREPPPSDIPKDCSKCDRSNARSAKVCRYCNEPLQFENRYDVWSDALITSYTGDIYGVTLGAHYRDVIRWISAMRPYPPRSTLSINDFYYVAYAITHVVYTLNDYGMHRLSPAWLPQEYQYLKTNLEETVKLEDPETLGEFMDTLRAFGMSEKDALIRAGVDYALSKQNADGSWGETDDPDIYDRYHSTWTAIDGLRQYAWHGERFSFPDLAAIVRGAR